MLCQEIGLPSDWCSCDLWAKLTKADTSYYNNIWGSGAGSQCIWVDSKSWGALASHPSTSGVKSYPNVSVFPRKTISDIKTYTSSFDITVPSGGAWDAAYDLTLRKDSTVTTVMLWVNHTEGRVFPKSSTSPPVISGVAVGGHVWNVYYAREGVFDIISFLRTGNVSAATVDIKAILGWLVANRPPLDATWTLDQLQFGFEIVANDSPQRFTCNSFSVSSS